MDPRKACETCAFWTGDETKAMANCRNADVYQSRTPYDYGCRAWVQKVTQPGEGPRQYGGSRGEWY